VNLDDFAWKAFLLDFKPFFPSAFTLQILQTP